MISFDLFDTLIMRKTLIPTDVFRLLDYELEGTVSFIFSEARVKAAERANEQEIAPDIDLIYEELQKEQNISDELRECLKQKEINKEFEVSAPRTDMIDIFHFCLHLNKKVIIVSDMYMHADILRDLLRHNGLDTTCEIYVSCEHKRNKKTGLADILKSKGKKVLHLGDNYDADIVAVSKCGISTYLIPSAIDLLRKTKGRILEVKADDLYKRCLLGLFLTRVLNSPFTSGNEKGRISISNYEQLASVITPIVQTQLYYMLHVTKSMPVSDIIIIARDGFLPFQLWNKILLHYGYSVLPKGKYVYSSGRASSIAAIETKEEIQLMLDEYRGTTEELFANIFDLDGYTGGDISEYSEKIMNKSEIERNEFRRYLDSADIDFKSQVLYFDFFSKGTGQDNIQKIINRTLLGIYLNKSVSGIDRRNELTFMSLISVDNHYRDSFAIFKYYSLIEYIFSSPEPCLKRIENGKPVFFDEDRSKEGIVFMKKMHCAIQEYEEELLGLLGKYVPVCEDVEYEDMLIGMLDHISEWQNLVPDTRTYEWFRGAYKGTGYGKTIQC